MSVFLANIDIGRAIFAVAIAVMLFGFVQNEENPAESGSFNVPIDIENVPSGLVIVGEDATPSVQVRVNAPRENWVSIRSSSFRATVDLSRGSPGTLEYPVTVEASDTRVRIVEVSPPRVTVRLDETLERPIQVRIVRSGNVPFGYELGEPEIDPNSVVVSGPATAVRRVDSAAIDLKLEGVTVEINGRFTPTLLDAQGQPVTIDGRSLRMTPSAVRLRVAVTQQLSYKTIGIQPSVVGSVGSGFAIEGVSTDPSAVTVVGPPRLLAGVNSAETEQIDVSDVTETFTRQAGLALPSGVSSAGPDSVRITVRVAPVVLTQSFASVPVVDDLGGGLQVISPLPTVQINVQGPASALRALRPGDLRVSASLDGLGPGTHQVTLDATAPGGMTVQSINPRIVNVTIADTSPQAPAPPPAVPPSVPADEPTAPTEPPVTATVAATATLRPAVATTTATATSTPSQAPNSTTTPTARPS